MIGNSSLGPPLRYGLTSCEKRQQPVIILLRNRIDLVIVAAGAIDRQAEKNLPGRGDDVVQSIESGLLPIARLVVPNAKAIIAGGDQAVVVGVESSSPASCSRTNWS